MAARMAAASTAASTAASAGPPGASAAGNLAGNVAVAVPGSRGAKAGAFAEILRQGGGADTAHAAHRRARPLPPGSGDLATAAGMAAAIWGRPTGPLLPPGEPTAPRSNGAPGGSAAVSAQLEALRVGRGPAGAEARLTIGVGPLAGAEIHLRQGPTGIDALVLTGTESSRHTLSVAMNEVARRLKLRGVSLRLDGESAPPRRPRSQVDERPEFFEE